MAVISNLAALTITANEQQTVQGTTPFEDATGELTSILADLNRIKARLTYFNNNMPSGSNKTAIATFITNLAGVLRKKGRPEIWYRSTRRRKSPASSGNWSGPRSTCRPTVMP